jgi:hypothetical protein
MHFLVRELWQLFLKIPTGLGLVLKESLNFFLFYKVSEKFLKISVNFGSFRAPYEFRVVFQGFNLY